MTVTARILAAALIAGTAFAPLAAAPVTDRTLSRTVVRYADLDLAHPDGAAALHARVKRAVSAVCGSADTRDLHAMQDLSACRATAMAAATSQIRTALAGTPRGQALAANEIRVATPGL